MLGVHLIFDSIAQYLAVCLVLICAETVYVLFGFGAGLIAVGTLAVLMPEVDDVVVLLLLVSLLPELSVVLNARRSIAWRSVLTVCLGIGVGVPLGTWILKIGEPSFILTVLGLFLVLAGAGFLILPTRQTVRWPTWAAPPVGLLSGLLSGMFGTGGPPLIFYYQAGGVPKAVFRGNLMAIFLLVTCVRVPSYLVGGLITPARLWSAVATLPVVLLGIWLGHRIHVRLSEEQFRRSVSGLLIVLGVVLLWQRAG